MKQKLKKIILMVVMALIVLFLVAKYVNAAGTVTPADFSYGSSYGIWQEVNVGGTFSGWPDTFCVQHQCATPVRLYYVFAHIRISGSVASGESTWVSNGSMDDPMNKKFAYILAAPGYGSGYGSYRQNAVWTNISQWVSAVGGPAFGLSWASPDGGYDGGLTEKAEEYMKSNEGGAAKIESLVGDNVTTSNTLAGPFKVKFTGKISDIDVFDTKDKEIPDSAGIKFYFDADKTKEITDLSKIESEKSEIYIANSSGRALGSVVITAKSTGFSVDIWFMSAGGAPQYGLIAKPGPNATTTKPVTIKITATGAISIHKKDADTGDGLGHAGFKLKYKTSSGEYKWVTGAANAQSHGLSDSFIDGEKYVTDGEGNVTIENLDLGIYHIYEVQKPNPSTNDYRKGTQIGRTGKVYDKTNDWVYQGYVHLTKSNPTTDVPIEIENRKYGNLKITKTDRETGDGLKAGFKIKFTSLDGKESGWLKGERPNYTYKNSDGQVYYTDASKGGELTLKDLRLGTYEVYEVEKPEGYKLELQEGYDKTNKWVKLKSKNDVKKIESDNQTIEFEGKNTKSGKIIIEKLNDANPPKKLEGAKFIIEYEDKDGKKSFITGKEKPVYGKTEEEARSGNNPYETDKEGKVEIPNLTKYGKYTIYEIKAPKDYELKKQEGYDEDKKWVKIETVELKEGEELTLEVKAVNVLTGKFLTITKIGDDDKPLAGAEFIIEYEDENGNKVFISGYDNPSYNITSADVARKSPHVYVTDKNGEIKIKNLSKYGTYHIYETNVPKGYDLKIQNGYDGTNKWVAVGSLSVTEEEPNPSIDVKNIKAPSLTIIKTGKDGKLLPGAEFKITFEDESGEKGSLGKHTTNEQGKIELNNIKFGTYTIEETKAPEGYKMLTSPITEKVDKDHRTITIPIQNQVEDEDGEITIEKVDEEGGHLNGAKFSIRHSTKGYLSGSPGGPYSWTASKKTFTVNGSVTYTNLPYGKYTITEESAPAGYKISTGNKVVTLSETNKSSGMLTFENKKDDRPGLKIIKVDSDGTGHKIPGVTFDLYRWQKHHDEYSYDVYWADGHTEERDQTDSNGNVVKDQNGNPIKINVWIFDEWVYSHTTPYSKTIYTSNDFYKYELADDQYNGIKEVWAYENIATATTDNSGIADFGPQIANDNLGRPDYIEDNPYKVIEQNNAVGYYGGSGKEYTFRISKSEEKNGKIITISNKKNILKVQKLDVDTGAGIPNVKFKLYSGEEGISLKLEGGVYNYDDVGSATVVTTNSSGEITFGRLPPGQYTLEELENEDKKYDIYVLNSEGKPAKGEPAGTKADVTGIEGETTVQIYDKKKVSISGRVWLDKQETKGHDTNGRYDDGEQGVAGVTVTLKRVDGKPADPPGSATTDENGYYEMKYVVDRYKANEYYVEFNYAGTTYKEAIPVPMGDGENGSKAIEETIPVAEEANPGLARTNKTGLEEFFDPQEKEGVKGQDSYIKYINLGIKQIQQPEYSLSQDLDKAVFNMNGSQYTYLYGHRNGVEILDSTVVKARWQSKNSISAYTREIYPSDISYAKLHPNDPKLTLDVVYKIFITDSEQMNIPDMYMERQLNITSLTNKFDQKRYTLNDSKWSVEDENSDEGVATYNGGRIVVGKGQTVPIEIKFSVKYDAIIDILNHPEGIIEAFPTQSHTVGYHDYTRNDYEWNDTPSGRVKDHTSKSYPRDAAAPYLALILGEDRVISGTVFRDDVDEIRHMETNEVLGNGFLDNGESAVKETIVQLIEKPDAALDDLATLYTVGDDKKTPHEINQTTNPITTKPNGTYEIKGIIPGNYYIRFLYGDGTQKTVDTEGNEISVSSKEYKSTIVTNTVAQGALGYGTNSHGDTWYRHLGTENASVAVDNMTSRKEANYSSGLQNVRARTAKAKIDIENTDDEEGIINEHQQLNQIKGMNFGIIAQPRQIVNIDKTVTYITLKNAQGNTIFSGNPQEGGMPGVTDLDGDNKNGGSKYVRVELAEESIYGSVLEVQYLLKVENNSEINYYGDNYYWFGDPDNQAEVALAPRTVTDQLDSTLKFIKYMSIDGKKVEVGSTHEEIEDNGGIKREFTDLRITGWDRIFTTKNTVLRKKAKKTFETAEILAERILATEDADLTLKNSAQVSVVERTTDEEDDSREDKEEIIKTIRLEVETPDNPEASIVITPPTGEDLQTSQIYIIVTTIALVVLASGIVIVKKFVKKDE